MFLRSWLRRSDIPISFRIFQSLLWSTQLKALAYSVTLFSFYYTVWLSGKESACNAGATGATGLIPGSGRSPGGGHGNPLQYSCLENPMDRGAWRLTVHGVTKSEVTKHSTAHTMYWGFPGGSDSIESTCNAGDLGSIPRLRRLLEKVMDTCSSIFAWRISWTGGLVDYSPWGCKSQTWLSDWHFHFSVLGLTLERRWWESIVTVLIGLASQQKSWTGRGNRGTGMETVLG